jgi:ATP/maltotriose-dependent transcriptional regulator MalT
VTRLADVARPVGAAFFTPIVRPRVLQRIDAAAAGRIVLIVAPAGYGKSLALSHWLAHQSRAFLRFDVQAEHNTLLGFARGLAEALSGQFPSLLKTISTAAQSSASAAAPGAEMARWIAANIEHFEGVIAIDDFHRAANDPEISRFVAALIGRTKSHVQWVIATRTALDIPVASWLGYGDVHFVVGDRDLTFSSAETQLLSEGTGESLSDEALREIMDATAGWPVALSLALRSAAVINGEKSLSTATRDVLFQYLAEQVYEDLTREEREVLHLASYLSEIRTDVLEAAGYFDSARVLEAVRRRATFLTLEAPGTYSCHELFREFLQRQVETNDPAAARSLQSKAAKGLESVGDYIAALRLYTRQRATADMVRILRATGFDLMDHAHGDAVESALSVLPQEVRTSDPILLGIRGQRESDLGHFERAEALFRRAIRNSLDETMVIALSCRYAVALMNEGRPVAHVLEPVLPFAQKNARAEILGLLSAEYSTTDAFAKAEAAILQAEHIACSLDDEAARARINLRIAVAGLNIGHPFSRIHGPALTASIIAEQLGLLGLAGRAYNVLASIALCAENNIEEHVRYAELARASAKRCGDSGVLETALLQLACAETQHGNAARLQSLLKEIENKNGLSGPHKPVRHLLRATLLAWRGDIGPAEEAMDQYAGTGYSFYDFDQVADIAWHAIFCTGAAHYPKALELCAKAKARAKRASTPHIYATTQIEIARALCGIIDVMIGSRAAGLQVLKTIRAKAASEAAQIIAGSFLAIQSLSPFGWSEQILTTTGRLHTLGLDGIRQTILMCISSYPRLAQWEKISKLTLTPAELLVMKMIGQGQTTKEIAVERGRSVHTVRTLIQRAIAKLGCNGRQEAVSLLRASNQLEEPS